MLTSKRCKLPLLRALIKPYTVRLVARNSLEGVFCLLSRVNDVHFLPNTATLICTLLHRLMVHPGGLWGQISQHSCSVGQKSPSSERSWAHQCLLSTDMISVESLIDISHCRGNSFKHSSKVTFKLPKVSHVLFSKTAAHLCISAFFWILLSPNHLLTSPVCYTILMKVAAIIYILKSTLLDLEFHHPIHPFTVSQGWNTRMG